MKNIETFSQTNAADFMRYAEDLAETYKIAFAGPPWFEVSACRIEECDVTFTSKNTCEPCEGCGMPLDNAYTAESLIDDWRRLLTDEDAWIELALNNNKPYRATITRPTDRRELVGRKYDSRKEMSEWVEGVLPPRFVWIEDTFANRRLSPEGNLTDRGLTLGKIAIYYSGLTIVTRTLNPAVVAATARDCSDSAWLYPGTTDTGYDNRYSIRRDIEVPDTRTLLRVNSGGLR